MKQDEFSSQSGVSYSAYQKYEMGRSNPGAEAIEGFIKLGINANWLLTGSGEMLLQNEKKMPAIVPATAAQTLPEGMVKVPYFEEVMASAGHGSFPDWECQMFFFFPEQWIRKYLDVSIQDLRLIRVSGDSMAPHLRNGDTILVDCAMTRPRFEGVYVLRLDGALLVKRVQVMPGGVYHISSDNPIYQPFTIKLSEMEGEDFAFIGRVIFNGRLL